MPLLSPRARGDRARPARLRRRALAAGRGRADRARARRSAPRPARRPRDRPRPHVAGNSLGAWVGLELGRIGAARSVTCLSPAGLWRGADRPEREPHPRVGAAPAPAGRRSRSAIPPLRRRALTTFSAHPERIPAGAGRELVLDWIDADGYEGANKAMREHVFDPAGLPAGERGAGDDRLGRARQAGRAAEARAPPGGRPLPRHARRRPHADVGRPRAGRPRPPRRQRPSRFRGDRRPAKEEQVDRREDREPAVAFERLPGGRQGARHRRPDRRQRRRRSADRHRRARRDHDHPLPRHPPARRPRRRGHRGARAGSATRRWWRTRRRRRSSTTRSR